MVVAGVIVAVVVGAGIYVAATTGRPAAHSPVALIGKAPPMTPIADRVMKTLGYGRVRSLRGFAGTKPNSGYLYCGDKIWSSDDQDCAYGGNFAHDAAHSWDLAVGVHFYGSISGVSTGFPLVETALDHGAFKRTGGIGSAAYVMPLFASAATNTSVTEATMVSGASLVVRDRNVKIISNFWCQNKVANQNCLSYGQAESVTRGIAAAILAELPYKS